MAMEAKDTVFFDEEALAAKKLVRSQTNVFCLILESNVVCFSLSVASKHRM
jgi:hypothetical protein